MKFSKEELIKKFPNLEKFKDFKWFEKVSIQSDCNYKELPFMVTLVLIKDLIDFTEKTKFNNHWEKCFSLKIRLKQVESLLLAFCEDTIEEKTFKGSFINQQDPTR